MAVGRGRGEDNQHSWCTVDDSDNGTVADEATIAIAGSLGNAPAAIIATHAAVLLLAMLLMLLLLLPLVVLPLLMPLLLVLLQLLLLLLLGGERSRI